MVIGSNDNGACYSNTAVAGTAPFTGVRIMTIRMLVTCETKESALAIAKAINASKRPDVEYGLLEETTPEEVDPFEAKINAMIGESTNLHDPKAPLIAEREVVLARARELAEMINGDTPADVTPAKRGGTQSGRSGNGRVKLYSPVGTAKQIRAALEALRPLTLDAFVYADLVQHPGSKNADIRERLTKNKSFAKAGLSVESVDNVIWRMVNKGLVGKADAK